MQKDVLLSGDRLALRMRELAKVLGVSIRTLWGWTKTGAIPHIRIGGAILYPVDSIRQWLQEQAKGQQESTQPNGPASVEG